MPFEGKIATELVGACIFCEQPGIPLYSGLSDQLFGTPGFWNFLQCEKCGLVWLNPRPVAAELSKAYVRYYTHQGSNTIHTTRKPLGSLREKGKKGLYAYVSDSKALADGWIWMRLGQALSCVPLLRERAYMGTMCLDSATKGKLLDLGCGDGRFLALMRAAGWDVTGIDTDLAAVKNARELGIPVVAGNIADAAFPEASFDAVTLSHVIEHVHDPVGLLSACRRVVKPGGQVVIVTPNIKSFGHKKFGSCWRGLEPPRHLHIFSLAALHICCERAGLQLQMLRTSARSAGLLWEESRAIRRRTESLPVEHGIGLRIRRVCFNLQEDVRCRVSEEMGGEIVAIARVQNSSFATEIMPASTEAFAS